MERDWTPGLCRVLGLDPKRLPLIWDADFLLGPKHADGQDRYVLCEINASSVFPIPDEAPRAIARALRQRLQRAAGVLTPRSGPQHRPLSVHPAR